MKGQIGAGETEALGGGGKGAPFSGRVEENSVCGWHSRFAGQ